MIRMTFLSACLFALFCSSLALAKKPEVVILATGGTIAGTGDNSVDATYAAAKLPVDKLLNAVPEIHDLAKVSGEQVSQIASQAMTTDIWLKLAKSVDKHLSKKSVAGIVITHGTDTMEETAYFLHLINKHKKPIVLVGSMRPSTSLSADGNINLYNAVAVAISDKTREVGAVVVMNDEIHAAEFVTKSDTTSTDTFVSRGKGPIGRVEYGEIRLYQQAMTKNKFSLNLKQTKTLPQVDILYGYANASAAPIKALVSSGSKGIVYAGVGNGNLFPSVEKALANARNKNTIVVRSSRVGDGHVIRNAEVNDDKWDFVVADNLSPQKARILLMLALTQTKDTKEIQKLFY